MTLQDNETLTGRDRTDVLNELREALEDMDWRNLQVAERMLEPYHLTFPQAAVLNILNSQGPDMEMSQIAARTGLPPSTITSIMDRLLLRRFVERRQNPADRRRITGSITEEGKRVVEELYLQRRSLLAKLLAGYSDDELALLHGLLVRWSEMAEKIISPDDTGIA